jgi:hypothetical protein
MAGKVDLFAAAIGEAIEAGPLENKRCVIVVRRKSGSIRYPVTIGWIPPIGSTIRIRNMTVGQVVDIIIRVDNSSFDLICDPVELDIRVHDDAAVDT